MSELIPLIPKEDAQQSEVDLTDSSHASQRTKMSIQIQQNTKMNQSGDFNVREDDKDQNDTVDSETLLPSRVEKKTDMIGYLVSHDRVLHNVKFTRQNLVCMML